MPAVTLKAHYDGERIILEEPLDMPPNSPLMVTVTPRSEAGVNEDWISVARKGLAAAYGSDEPEYGVEDLVDDRR